MVLHFAAVDFEPATISWCHVRHSLLSGSHTSTQENQRPFQKSLSQVFDFWKSLSGKTFQPARDSRCPPRAAPPSPPSAPGKRLLLQALPSALSLRRPRLLPPPRRRFPDNQLRRRPAKLKRMLQSPCDFVLSGELATVTGGLSPNSVL